MGTPQQKFDGIYFFYQHSQPLYDVMKKEIDNIEFVEGANFEFVNSLLNSVTKHLLIFDVSSEVICNSTVFSDLATAGSHHRLTTIYIKHNLFHQNNFGRDVELQNTQTLSSSSLPVIWCNSVRLVHNWGLD